MSKKTDKLSNTPESRRVTQYDIAAALGVSQVTVSLALRNDPRISEEQRVRVQEKAAELNYRPDPILSALSHYCQANLKKRKSATLAWINPFTDPSKLRKQYEFDQYWRGAFDTAQRLGFNLEEFRTSDLTLKRMDTIFKTRNIQGLIISSLAGPNAGIDWRSFPWQDYAAVRFGFSTAYPAAHRISSAQVVNACKTIENIRNKGYKRIGFFGHNSRTRLFSAGYASTQFYEPEKTRIPPLFYGKINTEYLYRNAIRDWIEIHQPDAIFTDSPHLPDILVELGFRIPDDIGLATTSIHDTPIDAGIDQSPEEIGRAAARFVILMLNEQHFGIPSHPNEILIEGSWVDGSMLPPKK